MTFQKGNTAAKKKTAPESESNITTTTAVNDSGEIKTSVLTPDEMAIFHRVQAETQDWKTITEGDVEVFSLGDDPFLPPPEALARERAREFKFRWITRSPQRLDQVRNLRVPLRWWVCNSTNTPFLSKHIDPVTGSVNREDQMLVFKPWWMFEKERGYKNELADRSTNSGEIMSRDKQSRDGVHMSAGVRTLEQEPMRFEVKGGDIIMGDQESLDRADGGRLSEGLEDLIEE